MDALDKLKSHIKTEMKKDKVEGEVAEGFEEKKKNSTLALILSLVFCVFSILYFIYMFIFQMECIIYNGQKPNGKIDWFGTVVPTVLLFMFCGPCMFLYRLFNRCTNNSMGNNVRRNNVRRNNTPRNNTRTNNVVLNARNNV